MAGFPSANPAYLELCGLVWIDLFWEQRGLSGCLASRPHAEGMSDLGSRL